MSLVARHQERGVVRDLITRQTSLCIGGAYVLGVNVCTSANEGGDHLGATARGGIVQGGHFAFRRAEVGVSSRREQEADDFKEALVSLHVDV